MRINGVEKTPSFKAQLSPDIKQGLLCMLDNVNVNTSSGRNLVKRINNLTEICPHIDLSIKKYDLQGDVYYGIIKTDNRTGKSVGISFLEDEKKDLFSKRHLEDIERSLELTDYYAIKLSTKKSKTTLDNLKDKLKTGYHIVSVWADNDRFDTLVEKNLAKAKLGVDSDLSFYNTGVYPDGTTCV